MRKAFCSNKVSNVIRLACSGSKSEFVSLTVALCRSELAAATQKRLEEAAAKKEEEERQKTAQRHVRKEYKCA